MAAPLVARGHVTGMMAVWRTGRSDPFSEQDLNFLVGLSQQAAIAIENARLFREARGGARGRRAGERREERVPRGDEPRDPHADERDHRDERPAAGDVARRRAAGLRRHDREQRRGAARDHQRHPRLLEDRGRPHGARAGAVRSAGVHRVGRRPRSARVAAKKGLEVAYDIEPGTPETAVGDVEPPPADPAEPVEQRGEVHRGRARSSRRRATDRVRAAGHDRVPPHRPRHRDRHPAGPRRPAVPVVQPGGRVDEPAVRRHRAGARDQQAPRRADGRHGMGRERRACRARAARSTSRSRPVRRT